MDTPYQIIQSETEFPSLSGKIVLDFEASGFRPTLGARVAGIGIGQYVENLKTKVIKQPYYYLPIRHNEPNASSGAFDSIIKEDEENYGHYRNLDIRKTMAWLKGLTSDPKNVWFIHNAKCELQFLWSEGLDLAGPIYDTMVVAHQFWSHLHNYGLEYLTRIFKTGFEHVWAKKLSRYLDKYQPAIKIDDSTAKKIRDYSWVPIGLCGPYCCEDLHSTNVLAATLIEKLNEHDLTRKADNNGLPSWSSLELFQNERDLIRVLSRMEYRGIKVDKRRAARLLEYHEGMKNVYCQAMWDQTGEYFKPSQVAKLVKGFEKLGGEIKYWTLPDRAKAQAKFKGVRIQAGVHYKGKQKEQQFTDKKHLGTDKPCFNSAVVRHYLEDFLNKDEELFNFINNFRMFSKTQFLISNFISKIIRLSDVDHRLHGSFNQHGTLTGRLSAAEPNLQNQPKAKGTTEEAALEELLGDLLEASLGREVRKLYIPSTPDHVLVPIDYDSIEYRLAVATSGDKHMIKAYQDDPHLDFHQATADLVGVDRDIAKTINFGSLYGAGIPALVALLKARGRDHSFDEVQGYVNRMYEARPALRSLINDLESLARRDRKIRNPFGRYVNTPVAFKALNYFIQGTAGDLMRRALVLCQKEIDKNGWPCEILLTVHDEIVFEMLKSDVLWLVPKLQFLMCDCPFFPLPITAGVDICEKNWGEKMSFDDWREKYAKETKGEITAA